jgi:hypothetical protein
MPLDIHSRKYQHAPDVGEDRYAGDPNATGEIGTGNFTVAQKNALGAYKQQSLMRYRDIDAYFCKACRYVFGVECPQCKSKSETSHPGALGKDDPMFEVRGDNDYDFKEGMPWVITTCRKCSFSFRVLVM